MLDMLFGKPRQSRFRCSECGGNGTPHSSNEKQCSRCDPSLSEERVRWMRGMRNANTESYRTEQAVLAERERCAKIADAMKPMLTDQDCGKDYLRGAHMVCVVLAVQIRGGK